MMKGDKKENVHDMIEGHGSNSAIKLVGKITSADKKKAMADYQEESGKFKRKWTQSFNAMTEAKKSFDKMLQALLTTGEYTQGQAINKIVEDHKELKGFGRATIYRNYLPAEMKRTYTKKPEAPKLPASNEPEEEEKPDQQETEKSLPETLEKNNLRTDEEIAKEDRKYAKWDEEADNLPMPETLLLECNHRINVNDMYHKNKIRCPTCGQVRKIVSEEVPVEQDPKLPTVNVISEEKKKQYLEYIKMQLKIIGSDVFEEIEILQHKVNKLMQENKRHSDLAIQFSEKNQKLEQELQLLRQQASAPQILSKQ